jgi:hypothetical protein
MRNEPERGGRGDGAEQCCEAEVIASHDGADNSQIRNLTARLEQPYQRSRPGCRPPTQVGLGAVQREAGETPALCPQL